MLVVFLRRQTTLGSSVVSALLPGTFAPIAQPTEDPHLLLEHQSQCHEERLTLPAQQDLSSENTLP